MRLVSVGHVKSDACLAKTIYDAMGRVLLARGTHLNDSYLKRLIELGHTSIYIEDDLSESIRIEDVIPEETRMQVSQITRETVLNTRKGQKLQERQIKRAVDVLIDELLNNKDTIVHLTEIRSLQDYTFKHSVNVCVLSLLTGIALGYHQLKLRELGIGALLHDIGKARLPEKLSAAGRFENEQEYQNYQKHCDYGWEILKENPDINLLSAHAALQHHERYDGSGYPRGLSGNSILEYARIVAVADVYDSMASDQPGKERILPHEVLQYLKDQRGIGFDPEIVDCFLPNIAPFPAGSIVQLNTGFRAIVVSVQKQNPTRPQIRLLYDGNGQKVEGIKYLDLMKHGATFITGVVDDAG